MSIERLLGGAQQLGEREVGIRAATDQLARDGHVLEPSGIDLSNFRRNPIVLWSHQPEQPVAVCTAIAVQDGALCARVQFAPEGASGTADEICALTKSGVVKGVSIGFNILEAAPLDPAKGSRGGLHITSSELLEISFVSIPADFGAQVLARSFAARPGAMAMLRALPAIGQTSVDRVLEHIARRRPLPQIALSPLQQFEAERQRAMTGWASIQIAAERAAQRKAEIEQLEAIGESYHASRH